MTAHARHLRAARRGAGSAQVRTVVVCLALLLEGMSASSINVQVAALGSDLGLSSVTLQLVAGAFLVAYAGVLPAAGRLVDSSDVRRVFLAGVAAFGTGCLICAAAPSGEIVVVGRLVQGAGAALSAPAALALVTASLPPGPERNRAVATYGAMGALGFSLGLVLPGFVVSAWGWRASFVVLVPLVLVVLAATWRIRTPSTPRGERPDLVGAMILTGTLMVAVHALGAVGTLPAPIVLVELAVVIGLVGLLVLRGGVVGFPSALLRRRVVAGCCTALAAVYAGVVASMYVLSLGLQHDLGASAFVVGLMILPQPLVFSTLSGFGGRMVGRFGAARLLAAGVAVLVVTLTWLAATFALLPTTASVLPAMAGVGLALALAFPAASVGAIDAAPEAYRGTTAGLLTASQNVGGALGLALVTALGLVPTVESPNGLAAGTALSALFVVVGGLAALMMLRSARRGEVDGPDRGRASAPRRTEGAPVP